MDDCFEYQGITSEVKVAAKKHKLTSKKVTIVVDNAGSSRGVNDEMNINYASEELGSSDLNASDEENDP